MRIAYQFDPQAEEISLEIWPSTKAGEASIMLMFEPKTLAPLAAIINPSLDCSAQAQLLGWMAKHCSNFAELSLRDFYQKALQDNSRQIVWDGTMQKWRNITTMKERESVWTPTVAGKPFEPKGVRFSVAASTQAAAQRRMVGQITGWMTDFPQHAAEAVAWFTSGQEITETVSGALPEYTSLRGFLGIESEEQGAPDDC